MLWQRIILTTGLVVTVLACWIELNARRART